MEIEDGAPARCGFCGARELDPCQEFGVRLETPHSERWDALFEWELDGPTFDTLEAAELYRESLSDNTGPIWSDYGGWVN